MKNSKIGCNLWKPDCKLLSQIEETKHNCWISEMKLTAMLKLDFRVQAPVSTQMEERKKEIEVTNIDLKENAENHKRVNNLGIVESELCVICLIRLLSFIKISWK